MAHVCLPPKKTKKPKSKFCIQEIAGAQSHSVWTEYIYVDLRKPLKLATVWLVALNTCVTGYTSSLGLFVSTGPKFNPVSKLYVPLAAPRLSLGQLRKVYISYGNWRGGGGSGWVSPTKQPTNHLVRKKGKKVISQNIWSSYLASCPAHPVPTKHILAAWW